jgi:hypothetical protein
VIIFIPVIVMVPVVWFGRRVPSRDRERTGTLWWYDFLVASMERAGPAFIKVREAMVYSSCEIRPMMPKTDAVQSLWCLVARSMGSVALRYNPPGTLHRDVVPPFQCPRAFARGYEAYHQQGV